MLELKIKAQGRRYVAPEGLRAALGAERAREKLADAIEALIVQMDLIDGDPDLELEDGGGETVAMVADDEQEPEDGIDPDLEDDRADLEFSGDEHGDPAWCEWDSLPAATRRSGALTAKPINPWHGTILEDHEEDDAREEDDPSGQCTEDEISSGLGHWAFGSGVERGPGCTISDPDVEHDTMAGGGSAERGQERWEEVRPFYALEDAEWPSDEGDPSNREIMRRTLRRIREERCLKVESGWGGRAYRLRRSPFDNPGVMSASNLN